MKLIIDIDDKRIKGIKLLAKEQDIVTPYPTLEQIIANGTPLGQNMAIPQTDCNTCDKAVRNRVGVIGCAKFDSKPTVAQADGDLISRKDAIEFFKYDVYIVNELKNMASVAIPSATGHWKRISMDKYTTHAQHWYECDKCGEHNLGDTNFCPNCGADMRGEQDGKDNKAY